MKMKQIALTTAVALGLVLSMPSCKSQAEKDAELKAKIEAAAPGVTVTVSEGVATLSGTVNDDAAKTQVETAVKNVSGVKSVVNNIDVPPPVIINPDETLITAVNGVLTNFAGVTATVNQGVVTLTGDIKRADLQGLMQAVNALNPKSVDNKLNIK